MEYNYINPTPVPKSSMSERITNLYESIYKVLSVHYKLNEQSMIICQSIGYNGFKRWHRYRTRQLNELKICLVNEIYDKFRIRFVTKDYEVKYSPSSLQEHLELWEKSVLDGIQELGTLNKTYFEEVGFECKIIRKAMNKLMKDYEKIGRLYKRFTDCDWLAHDIHVADNKLHEKYKCKEMNYGYKE